MIRGTKFVVYGPSGSGKSTFARALAETLKLPHIELDALFHNKPDWNDASEDEFRAAVREKLAEHPGGWVSDGNYHHVTGILLDAADIAIWLRLPFRVVYPRLVRRTFRRAATGELLWGTNHERWKDVFGRESMLLWGITNWQPHREKTRAKLRGAPLGVQIKILRSTKDVAGFLEDAANSG